MTIFEHTWPRLPPGFFFSALIPAILAAYAALKLSGISFLGILSIVAVVRAQPIEDAATAGNMLEMCKAQTETPAGSAQWVLCAGRIQGWMTAHYMSALAYGGASRRLYCEPSDWTVSQIAAIFVEWAEAHPEQSALRWNNALMKALQEAFPCKRE
jgi:hypothetical protein